MASSSSSSAAAWLASTVDRALLLLLLLLSTTPTSVFAQPRAASVAMTVDAAGFATFYSAANGSVVGRGAIADAAAPHCRPFNTRGTLPGASIVSLGQNVFEVLERGDASSPSTAGAQLWTVYVDAASGTASAVTCFPVHTLGSPPAAASASAVARGVYGLKLYDADAPLNSPFVSALVESPATTGGDAALSLGLMFRNGSWAPVYVDRAPGDACVTPEFFTYNHVSGVARVLTRCAAATPTLLYTVVDVRQRTTLVRRTLPAFSMPLTRVVDVEVSPDDSTLYLTGVKHAGADAAASLVALRSDAQLSLSSFSIVAEFALPSHAAYHSDAAVWNVERGRMMLAYHTATTTATATASTDASSSSIERIALANCSIAELPPLERSQSSLLHAAQQHHRRLRRRRPRPTSARGEPSMPELWDVAAAASSSQARIVATELVTVHFALVSQRVHPFV